MTAEKEIKLKKGLGIVIGVMLFALAALGVTYAYFARTISSNISSLGTTENVDIVYSENKNYMYNNLIPASLQDAIEGASKVDNKCMDDNNNYVCGLYEFTVDNNSNVSQDIDVYLYQQINTYTNLKYIIYETSINNSSFDNQHMLVNSTSLIYPTTTQNELGTRINALSKTLTKVDDSTTTDSVTYTLVFYVENKDYNQSIEDSGKQIIADIHVVSKISDQFPSTNNINIPDNIGPLTTQTKYYLEDSTVQFIAFYNDYAIIKMDEDVPVAFTGFVYNESLDQYTLQVYTGSMVRFILTITNNGDTFSIDGTDLGTGIMTYNKSNDLLPVLYDKTLGIYVNTIYYDNGKNITGNKCIEENVCYGTYDSFGVTKNNNESTYWSGSALITNDDFNDRYYLGDNKNDILPYLANYQISSDYKTLTNNNTTSLKYGYTYSIREING